MSTSSLRFAAMALWISGAALAGCETEVKLPEQKSSDTNDVDGSDAGTPHNVCAAKEDGTACGEEKHCLGERCLVNLCGDGVRAGDEMCDDGNVLLGDPCTPSCQALPQTCGDGKLDAGEECDDSNLVDDDACSNACFENECGNQRRDPGEQCDDGNENDADYCDGRCRRTQCRNGTLDPGEECDDGNADDRDGCTNDCRAMKCGDGVRNPGAPLFEECDDGNGVNEDACANDCRENRCGNNRVDLGELCDGTACELAGGGQGVCSASCDQCEDDRCNDCLAQHCADFEGSGVDFYTPCMESSEGAILVNGNEPGPTFTQDCRAVVECARFSGCVDLDFAGQAYSRIRQENPSFAGLDYVFHTCACEDAPYASSMSGCEQFSGACLDVILQSTLDPVLERSCAEAENPKSCLEGRTQDFTFASGYAWYLIGKCMLTSCRAECGFPE